MTKNPPPYPSSLLGLFAFLCPFGILATMQSAEPADPAAVEKAAEILKQSKVTGGFIVLLDARDGHLADALGASGNYTVHGLAADGTQVDKARQYLLGQGRYGMVSIEQLASPERLPYIDNLVNLVVSESDPVELGISMEEITRILRPNGIAIIKSGGQWKKTVKPWPENIDEWTHYFHDADRATRWRRTRWSAPPAADAVGRQPALVAPPRPDGIDERPGHRRRPHVLHHGRRVAGLDPAARRTGN